MASSLLAALWGVFLEDGLETKLAESTDSGSQLQLVSLVPPSRQVLLIRQWYVLLPTYILTHMLQWLVGRFITGFAAGQTMAALPTYFSEVSPPHSRGLMAGAHGSFINIGFALAGWIGFGCYFSSSSVGWRFPNAVLALWGICLLISSFLSG